MHTTQHCSFSIRLLLRCWILIPVSFCQFSADAQNLVPNPSFEEFEVCPVSIGFQSDGKPLAWEKWLWSPEYFNSCVEPPSPVDTLLDVPQNGFGFQYAFEGDGYIGLYTFTEDDYREYVGCELLEPLIVGETYELSFYTNRAFSGTYWNPTSASNNIGMLFTTQSNIWSGLSGPPFPPRNYSHLSSSEIVIDTSDWVFVDGIFVADSAYQYVVLGNFFDDSNTDTLNTIHWTYTGAYYYIDYVCVRRFGSRCDLENDIGNIHNFRPPVLIAPNPANDQFTIDNFNGTLIVHDMLGRAVKTLDINGATSVNVATLPRGIYRLWSEFGPIGTLVLSTP